MGSINFINEETHIYYAVSVDHTSIAAYLTISDWRVLRSAVYPIQRMRHDDMLWDGS